MRTLYISFLLVILGFAACTKEGLTLPSEEENPNYGITTITASLEGNTRTVLEGNDAGGYKVVWSEGDQITAIDANDQTYKLTLAEGAGTTSGVFESSVPMPDGDYRLFYCTEGDVLDRIQTYNGEGVVSNAPMYTTVAVKSGNASPATFMNLCGLVRLTLKGVDNIKKITISSDEAMSGPVRISEDGRVIFNRNYHQDVSLSLGEGVELSSEGTTFYIALPPNEYHDVSITVTDTDGYECTRTLKSGKTLDVTRSLITPVGLSVNYVNLSVTSSVSNVKCKSALISGQVTCSPKKVTPMSAVIYFSRTLGTSKDYLITRGRKLTVNLNSDGSFSETLPLLNSNQLYYYTVVAKAGITEAQTKVSYFVTNTPPVATAVDLGLSVKWASFNIGAESPVENGDYYQWAGTRDVTDEQIILGWENAPYHVCGDMDSGWTKYDAIPGSSTYDGISVIQPDDDVAQVKWKGKWRMPTIDEWKELISNCFISDVEMNGVWGLLFTSRIVGYREVSIFIPKAGFKYDTDIIGDDGRYWSSSLIISIMGIPMPSPASGWTVCIPNFRECYYPSQARFQGLPVRPVCAR